eukprot:m.62615 g.62615  ORF g.62615 m.62615 type:complete len:664 (+) comp7408_c0_seq2:20-2011(+)
MLARAGRRCMHDRYEPVSASQCVARLGAAEAAERISAVKTLRNAVIGSTARKDEFLQAGAVPRLVELLMDTPEIARPATSALGSFAHGRTEHLAAVATEHTVGAMSACLETASEPVAAAVARTLRIILAAAPHLASHLSEKAVALCVDFLHKAPTVAEAGASLLACLAVAPTTRDATRSALRSSNGLSQLLTLLTHVPPLPASLAALEVFEVLSRNDAAFCAELRTDPLVSASVVAALLRFHEAPTRATRVRAACSLSHLLQHVPSLLAPDVTRIVTASLLVSFTETDALDVTAGHELSALLNLHPELQIKLNTPKLTAHIESLITKSNNVNVQAAALRVLAALCSTAEENRAELGPRFLPLASDALKSSDETVQIAGCECILSFSRSIKLLRTTFVEVKMVDALQKLLESSQRELLLGVSACICNLVMDFSPLKRDLLTPPTLKRLAELCRAPDAAIRSNGVLAVKNMLFSGGNALPFPESTVVMDAVGYAVLSTLLNDEDARVVADALGIVQNLLHRDKDITGTLGGFGGPAQFLALLEGKLFLMPTCMPEVIAQLFFIVTNLTTHGEELSGLLLESSQVSASIADYLHDDTHLTLISVLLTIESLMMCPAPERARALFQAKMDSLDAPATLRSIRDTSPFIDAQNLAKRVLERFETRKDK